MLHVYLAWWIIILFMTTFHHLYYALSHSYMPLLSANQRTTKPFFR